MRNQPYYSVRNGRNLQVTLDLSTLLRLFNTLVNEFFCKDYFQEAFGYECVDAGQVEGKAGADVEAFMLRKLRKTNLWPIQTSYIFYSEDDLFDMIEFIYDYIWKPVTGHYHEYNQCGWHYSKFNQEDGQREFRDEINQLIGDYKEGFELSEDGEILSLPEPGLVPLMDAPIPTQDSEKVEAHINAAIQKFRSRHSSPDDRRDAVRDLADVLEFLRPKLKQIIIKRDEADLFNIANNFAIRHHNDAQKTDYDKAIWYSWMFYFYLATIHAALRLIQKQESASS